MDKFNDDIIENIIKLFLYMPKDVFENIFLNEKVVELYKLNGKRVENYLDILKTNIIGTLVIGLQTMIDSIDSDFIEKCTKLYDKIISKDLSIDEQLKIILKSNNIFTKPN